jgi:DNA-binding transcriptional ArsR family regulator
MATQNGMSMESLRQAAECLKVVAHPVRLKMIELLLTGPLPVGALAQRCGLAAHSACGHLRLMQGHGLLSSRRRGRCVYYNVLAPQLRGILRCIKANCARSQE